MDVNKVKYYKVVQNTSETLKTYLEWKYLETSNTRVCND